jgi:hypothetical protein
MNIGSVGLFPVKTSRSMIPKLNTSLLRDAFPVGVVPNSLQDIGRASDGAKRRPAEAEG